MTPLMIPIYNTCTLGPDSPSHRSSSILLPLTRFQITSMQHFAVAFQLHDQPVTERTLMWIVRVRSVVTDTPDSRLCHRRSPLSWCPLQEMHANRNRDMVGSERQWLTFRCKSQGKVVLS